MKQLKGLNWFMRFVRSMEPEMKKAIKENKLRVDHCVIGNGSNWFTVTTDGC